MGGGNEGWAGKRMADRAAEGAVSKTVTPGVGWGDRFKVEITSCTNRTIGSRQAAFLWVGAGL